MIRRIKSESERFWPKVEMGNLDECWLWNASRDNKGYGQFVRRNKQHVTSSRMAWILTHGEVERKMCVCHKCDNPPCCNPNHLFVGTYKDNFEDMDSKGRRNPATGTRNSMTTLTPELVRAIRTQSSEGLGYRKLSVAFGVHQSTVRDVVRRVNWKYVD